MKRRLLNLLTALSLLLRVAVCVLWVRSYERNEIFTHAATLRRVPDGRYDRLIQVGWDREKEPSLICLDLVVATVTTGKQ